MTDKDIIEKALSFLVKDYNFSYLFETPNGNDMRFIYNNKYGSFIYYQWTQFKEEEFSIITNHEYKKIQLFLEYPDYFSTYNKTHKGIKWFFKDNRMDYWDMISQILKHEISKNGSLFDLRVI